MEKKYDSVGDLEAHEMLDAIGVCPNCGGFLDIRFKSCECGSECPIIEDCVGLVIVCPQCDDYYEVEKKFSLGDAVKTYFQRTKKYRARPARFDCGFCGHMTNEGCKAENDFTAPQWETTVDPSGEWKHITKCRLFLNIAGKMEER
jgi:hypothetical protein